jgi:hypothetical protein
LRQGGFAGAEAITMIAPTERHMLAGFRVHGYATFLARPVRGETLLRVLVHSRLPEPAASTPRRSAWSNAGPPIAAASGKAGSISWKTISTP